MKRLLLIGVLMFAFALTVSTPAFAGDHDGDGSEVTKNDACPPGFDESPVHSDDAHGEAGHGGSGHKHVGNDKDQNGDGLVCIKRTGKDSKIHVHADNNYPRG